MNPRSKFLKKRNKEKQKSEKNKKQKKVTTMTLIHFHMPFVLRATISPNGTFQNEGFFVCDDGAIVLDTVNKIIIVIENDDSDTMANAR